VFSRAKRLSLLLSRLSKATAPLSAFFSFHKVNSDTYALDRRSIAKKMSTFAVMLLAASSLNTNIYGESFAGVYNDDSAAFNSIIVSDSDGYLTKISPQTSDSNRVGMTDKATHTVESGETLSLIAAKYGVSEQTIVWENNLPNKNSLRTGQKLVVPPVDGVSHNVSKGQTLDKISSLYNVDKSLIVSQNKLQSEILSVGQQLLIPGGAKIIPQVPKIIVQQPVREANSRETTATRAVPADLSKSNEIPAPGQTFIFPTRGKITQYFSRSHYAYDIADASMPPIWAAASGVVEKVSVGTWGGGYGNHIIIDHGNGYKTLYAHMNQVYVAKGQYISQGEAVGQMGNTGRVYGRTGIHLHFEVRLNGVKLNPGNFF
jgi:murein DD-endopeptidase MepM/ murein hydrolase activator NlpD